MGIFSQQQQGDATGTYCYRHRNRPTNVRCSNCERPICEDCMRESPVGYRCPECAPQRKFVLTDDYPVTKVVVAICVIVFVAGLVMDAADPLRGASNELAVKGGLAGVAVPSEPWRLLTSGFLHAGLIHVAFNSFFIWSFGRLLEPVLGSLRYGLLYFASLFGGALGALLLTDPATLTVGASGAAFGLLGATLVLARVRRIADLEQNLWFLAGINFLITFTVGGISVGGHLGGFVVGLVAGYVVLVPLARQRQAAVAALIGAIIVLALAGYLVADAQLGDASFVSSVG